MKRSTTAFLAVPAVLACFLAGCGKAAPGAEKTLHLAFLTNNAANFWTIARRGCEDAAREIGDVEVEFRIPGSGSAAEQRRILEDLLAKGVDGIAVSPVDPDNQTALLDAAAERALLVTQDSDAPKSRRKCYIGTDNFAAGVQAGEMIKEALPGGGKIMVFVGKKDAQNARDRFAGIRKALEGSPVEILDLRTDDTDTVRAKNNARDALVNHPDLAGLVGLWNYNGPAILSAVRDAGKAGRVKIVCFDEEEETLDGVAQGAIYATVVQQPFEFGRQAILRMARYLRGDAQAFPESGVLVIPTRVIRKADVADFRARLKELLGE